MLRQISLASAGLVVGGLLTVIGVIAYATGNATLNLAGFFYGIPLILGGLALKAGELKPIPLETAPELIALRQQQATPTQTKLRKDVTRYAYGQSAHLQDALQRLGLSPNDAERPLLTGLRETAIAGAYTLTLEFESPMVPLVIWQQKQEKLETYFGPGIRAELSQPREHVINLALVATFPSQASLPE